MKLPRRRLRCRRRHVAALYVPTRISSGVITRKMSCSGAARLVQLRVDRARRLLPGCPARPRAPPGVAARNRSAEPKCWSSARRRAGPTPCSVSKIDSRALRVAALAVEAEREAVRLVADPLQQLEPGRVRSSTIGSGRPGHEDLLLALGERDHRDARQVVRLHRLPARPTSWPLPPSTRPGSAWPRTTRRTPAAARASSRANRRDDDLLHRREVVLAVELRTPNLR